MPKFLGHDHQRDRRRRITRFMARDGTACAICGEPLDRSIDDPDHPRYITFDHVIPRAHGGTDDERNLRLAHKRCNEDRGAEPVTASGGSRA